MFVNSMSPRDLTGEVLQVSDPSLQSRNTPQLTDRQNPTPWKALRQLPGTVTELSDRLSIIPDKKGIQWEGASDRQDYE